MPARNEYDAAAFGADPTTTVPSATPRCMAPAGDTLLTRAPWGVRIHFVRTLAGVTLAGALLLQPASARGATLQGELSLGRGKALEVAEAVIWVEVIPAETEAQLARVPRLWFWQRWLGWKEPAPPPPPHVIEISRRFLPRVTAVPAGGRVVFHNRDKVWHGVFSVTPGHRFELGKRAPGRIDTLHSGRAGIVQMRCDIHPDMTGWVVVTPNRAFTRPDAAGQWRLPDLPPGRYLVRAWHPDRGALKRVVRLTGRDDAAVALRW